MKKVLLILLALVLSISIISCSKNDKVSGENGDDAGNDVEIQDESGEISEQHKKIKENGCLIGVAYLGERDSATEDLGVFLNRQSYWDEHPMFLDISPINFVEESGAQLFLIIPLKDVTTKVYHCNYDAMDGTYEKGEEIDISKKGAPFFLQGNMADPSFVVVAEGNGKKAEFLLLADTEKGKLVVGNELVYDIFS